MMLNLFGDEQCQICIAEQLTLLDEQKVFENGRCPRCGSTEILDSREIAMQFEGFECGICGYGNKKGSK